MNCAKVRKHLSLYVGGELSSKKAKAVKHHLEICSECQSECASVTRSIRTAREWLNEHRVVWDETEWNQRIQNGMSRKVKSLSDFAPRPFKKGWAFVALGAILAVLIFFVTRLPILDVKDFPEKTLLSKRLAKQEKNMMSPSPQEVVSMTMVSKETGLKIVWILDKNFNLEENK